MSIPGIFLEFSEGFRRKQAKRVRFVFFVCFLEKTDFLGWNSFFSTKLCFLWNCCHFEPNGSGGFRRVPEGSGGNGFFGVGRIWDLFTLPGKVAKKIRRLPEGSGGKRPKFPVTSGGFRRTLERICENQNILCNIWKSFKTAEKFKKHRSHWKIKKNWKIKKTRKNWKSLKNWKS